MLIRFLVENFLSFKEEIEFSMIAGQSEGHESHVRKAKNNYQPNVLKSAVIYGANASGKSNLVKAMSYAKELVISEYKKGQSLPYNPYKLCKDCLSKLSKFEFEFKVNNKIFSYGFSLNSKYFFEEWLIEVGRTSDKVIFERKTSENGVVEINFNPKKEKGDLKRLEYIAEDVLPNQLFLGMINKRNVSNIEYTKPLVDAYNWFDKTLTIIFPESKYSGLEVNLTNNKAFSRLFQGFLELFDTGVNGISQETIDIDNLSVDLPVAIKKKIIEDLKLDDRMIIANNQGIRFEVFKDNDANTLVSKIMTKHKNDQNGDAYFEISEESDGTQRLMDLIPALIDVSRTSQIFVIDEIDRSLHPLLTQKLLDIFYTLSAKNDSQLIITTHETNLLDLELVRRDEVWFVQKEKFGVSRVYSLDQYKPRNDLKVQRGYLLGRYGAIPFVKKDIDITEII